MPWNLVISRDHDKTDVGQASATFVEQGQTEPVFSFSKRIKFDADERSAFFTEAYAARSAWRSRVAWENTNAASNQTLMNSNDPNPLTG